MPEMRIPAAPPGAEEYARLGGTFGVSVALATAAAGALVIDGLALLALSGKQGSGKDRVGAAVMTALAPRDAVKVAFGDAVVTEGNRVVKIVEAAADEKVAVAQVADDLGIDVESARLLVGHLWTPVRGRWILSAGDRHPLLRVGLQCLGDIRRAQDPDYWLRPGVSRLMNEMAQGRNVYITDVRTRAEADLVRALGFVLVRLDITGEVQSRRLGDRAGGGTQPAGARHANETVLDDYESFDLRLDNDGDERLAPDGPIVSAILGRLRLAHAARLTGSPLPPLRS